MTKWIAAALAVVIAIGAFVYLQPNEAASGEIRIETSLAETGSIRRSVAASGAVRALVTVEVGSQLSGQISELFVDFNDDVEAGQIIAQLDPQTFETRVREAEASYATAIASLQLQRASYNRVVATTRTARLEYERTEALHQRGNASQAALDNASASLDAAEAELGVAEAQIANAQAVVRQREATLAGARIDLERTSIRSPISGIVVDRAVDQGQTVAASLSSPTLFTIAQDLSQVQIDAQIDEADIGQIVTGQPVSFTVDAFPDLELNGVVEQIRLAPVTLQNVVTYTVVVSADNPRQRLLPGMTANMDIVTGERSDVLTVSNAALRFRPSDALAAISDAAPEGGAGPGRRGGPGGGARGGAGGRMLDQLDLTDDQRDRAGQVFRSAFQQAQASGTMDRGAIQEQIASGLSDILTPEQMRAYRDLMRAAAQTRAATVWVETSEGRLEERRVRVGISDTQRAEIAGGNLQAGEAVVTRAREVRG
ncbi:MAG: HlyD family efflux transporter periplasmic adaptor subunit [Alphaproteobacteria bacterium]|nr:HlyD family efflux transporter periplasmic adaptor subunit [Alphaproteobacteria bacterium]